MSKRRPALDPSQLGFTFDAPAPARREADLAGLDRVAAAAVAQALKGDTRTRGEIAGAMGSLLVEEISGYMLDAYASEARDTHNISAARFFALIAVTERFDLLDSVLRRIGASLLVGEEIFAARLGHLEAARANLDKEIKAARLNARPIARGDVR